MSDPYYTHRKYLKKELSLLDSKNKLKILEFGVGEGSSSIFNEFALNNKNIKIEAFETDKAWLDETKEKYELDNYKFTHIDNWNDFLIEKNFQENYDLIFVDQSPWEARVKTLDILINKSSVTILHDYDYFNKGFIEDIFNVGEKSFFGKYLSKEINTKPFCEELPPTLIFTKNRHE